VSRPIQTFHRRTVRQSQVLALWAAVWAAAVVVAGPDDIRFGGNRLSPAPPELPPLLDAPVPAAVSDRADDRIRHVTLRSSLLSEFWGREMVMHAAIVIPKLTNPLRNLAECPVAYVVHGFGGSHLLAWRLGPRELERVDRGESPPVIQVYLDASCPLGHHEFADSVNNGPRGAALIRELIPTIEAELGGVREQASRYVTGHSSGGWSALWLQVNYPDTFGGCWATAPDSADFRDFSGINLYEAENLYRDEEGGPRALVLDGDTVAMTVEAFVLAERREKAYGGQIDSFDAVFSPRGDDGRPQEFFDRTSGAINREVVDAWRRYDIGLILRSRWAELGPKLTGKIHLWCGEQDTFGLAGSARLLAKDLAALGGDADVRLIPGRNHFNLHEPHPTHWPDGLLVEISRQMSKTAVAEKPLPAKKAA